METGYKLLRIVGECSPLSDDVIGGELLSLWQDKDRGGVVYREDLRTVPQNGCGPLGVYSTLYDAKVEYFDYAINYSYENEIYRCVYIPSTEKEFWYQQTWYGGYTSKARGRYIDPDDHVIFADMIQLTKLVWWEYDLWYQEALWKEEHGDSDALDELYGEEDE